MCFVHAHAKSLQLCQTLCNPMDCSPQDSFVHGILQARTLECIAMPSSRGFPNPEIKPTSPALAGGFLTTRATWEAHVLYSPSFIEIISRTPGRSLRSLLS